MTHVYTIGVCERCNASPNLQERVEAEIARSDSAKNIPVFDVTDWNG